jgi:pilus assembly protein CpaC
MNQLLRSAKRQSVAATLLFPGLLAAAFSVARAQAPVVIPPGAATPVSPGQAGDSAPAGPHFAVKGLDDHLKMVVNSSRFLVLDKKIPQVQVNNPDVLDVVPISPNQVQISAKRTGVTQVNLWGDDKRIYTVTVIVTGDTAELVQSLRELFPRASLTVMPINGDSVMISGYVDNQENVPKILNVASKFFPNTRGGDSPNVIDNMKVSGVQQAKLHVKVVEVSRSKLRNLGFDFAMVSTNGNMVMSGVNGLLTTASGGAFGPPGGAPDNVLKFSVAGANAFYGVINALREDNLGKLISEPDIMATSGRPAYVLVGGELGYTVTNALSGTMVGFKEYGTRVDFLPIVLGNGRIHIDVRSRVSEPDPTNNAGGIPSLKTREAETGVELRAGQTLAIAGLIEQRSEALNHGLPWISEIPYLGALFRSVHHLTNEVELLILVTPEIVDGMDPGQVPACLPGSQTTDPSDWELFFKGYLEVPNCCPDDCTACQPCAPSGTRTNLNLSEGPISRQNPQNRTVGKQVAMNPRPAEPGFIGPIGYDVLK